CHLALTAIAGIQRQRLLKHIRCPVELMELDQADSISVPGRDSRFEERGGFIKVHHRSCTIPLLELEHRKHCVAGQVLWPKHKKMLQDGNAGCVSAVIRDLRNSL